MHNAQGQETRDGRSSPRRNTLCVMQYASSSTFSTL
jgi:hypothetical protein